MALLLDPLFSPKSVAVIGASANQDRTGYKFTHELLMRFPGKVFPINPKGGEVDGRPMYKSMAEAGEPADLALILVNKKAALAAVTDCAVHGVKVGVMYTAGFGEMGEEGARIQQEMVRVANEHGMRLVGPNCMGVFSHPAGLNLTGEEIPGGDIALISQSGNIGFSLWYDAANYLHTGFSRFVGFGNQADIAVHEYIDYCADDPMSKIIVIYLEGLRPGSGLDFIRSASAAAKKKPVVILKGGRSTAGKRAASSHTGSLAGNEALYSAAFEKAGIVEVKRLDELMPVAQTLMLCPPLKSGNIIVGGTGGGHMIVSTDAAEREGFCMPPFSPEAEEKKEALLYDFAPKGNPFEQAGTFIDNLDVWAQLGEVMLEEPQMEGWFTFGNIGGYLPDLVTNGVDWEAGMRHLVEVKNRFGKPVVAFSLCARSDYPCERVLREGGIPVFDSPDIAMRAMRALREVQVYRDRNLEIGERVIRTGAEPACFAEARTRESRNLTEPEAYGLMESYGIPTAPYTLAKSAEEAASAAEKLGYPVVMKVVSPQIIHKSDYGAVRVGLQNAAAAREAYDAILASCREKAPGAEVHGVLVTRMVSGQEIIAGLVHDRQFGPTLMVGLGGVFVEILKDVNFCILPGTRKELRDKIESLKGYPLLNGARGREKADVDALVELLYNLGRLAVENPEIQEMDINPIFVSAEGAVAADARIIVDGRGSCRGVGPQ